MAHYLIVREETHPRFGSIGPSDCKGPVEAVNPKQAVIKEDISVDPIVPRGEVDITVWPIQEGARGKAESWSKEDLDL